MKVLIVLLAFAALLSCKKKGPSPPSIKLGNEDGMIVNYYDKTIDGSLQQAKSDRIDIDGDGIFDIQVKSAVYYYNLIGLTGESSIESLHPRCEILMKDISDTTFVYTLTQENVNQNNEPILIQTTAYSCKKETSTSEVYSVKTSWVLDYLNKGTIINIGNTFKSELAYFSRANMASYGPTGEVSQGFIHYEYISHIRNCSEYPPDAFTYIGVKMLTPNGVKLGWIRLKVKSGKKVTIHSSAIQE